MKKIVGIGACVYDTLLDCLRYPKEDGKSKSEEIFVSGGGPVGNALAAASKLGLSASVTGAFAGDGAGMYILEDLKRCGVDTSRAKVIGGASSFVSYVILSREKKSRTCIFNRGNLPDSPGNVDFSAIDEADVLHLDGNYLESAIASAEYARSHFVKVSLDAGGMYEGIERLLPLVDILIPSAEFAMGFTGKSRITEAMEELSRQFRPEILAVTDGGEGGYYLSNGKIEHYDAVKVEVVDSNGAGDTFHGAFLAAYCAGKSVADCCRFASATAAFKCGHRGLRSCEFVGVEDFFRNGGHQGRTEK